MSALKTLQDWYLAHTLNRNMWRYIGIPIAAKDCLHDYTQQPLGQNGGPVNQPQEK